MPNPAPTHSLALRTLSLAVRDEGLGRFPPRHHRPVERGGRPVIAAHVQSSAQPRVPVQRRRRRLIGLRERDPVRPQGRPRPRALAEHPTSSSFSAAHSSASSMSGTPITDTDAKDFPAGAYVDDTVDGKQQLLMSPSPSPLRYGMGAGKGGVRRWRSTRTSCPRAAPVADEATRARRRGGLAPGARPRLSFRVSQGGAPLERDLSRALNERRPGRLSTAAVAFTRRQPAGEASFAHGAWARTTDGSMPFAARQFCPTASMRSDEVEEPRRGGEFRVEASDMNGRKAASWTP